MAQLNVRIPPHSNEAEESVIGSLLLDKDTIIAVGEFLHADDFYDERNKVIYECALELYENRTPIDVLTLSDKLKKKKALKQIGGSAYLVELANKVPTSAHAEHYGKIIKEAATKRALMKAASKLAELSMDEGTEVLELLDKAEFEVFAITQNSSSKSFVPLKDALSATFDRMDELHKSGDGMRGIPSGYKDLDATLSGFQRSNLVILAARPSVGKTSFALNIAANIALTTKKAVGFFSLEMSVEELSDRMVVSLADIDAWKYKTGKLNDDEFNRLSEAMGVLYEAPIYIDDTPGISMLEMRTRARRLQVEHGLDILFVDYLQLAKSRNLENRVQEVSEISQGLKNIARELKIPVVALSQLSRSVEQRGEKRPQLSDLRDSGSIEQDADIVMFLYREDDDAYEAAANNGGMNVALDIAKHRNGALKSIKLFFKGDRMKFFQRDEKRGKS